MLWQRPRAALAVALMAGSLCGQGTPTGEYCRPSPFGFLVRVVDARDGRPVPGATVFYGEDAYVGTDQGSTRRRIGVFARHPDDVLARYGKRFRCDERGEVRVPWSGRQGCLTARAGGLWGVGVIRPLVWDLVQRREPVLVQIDEGHAVAVQVRDGAGLPVADAPVSVRVLPWYGFHALLRATTDAAGRATFRHVDKLVWSDALGELIDPADRWDTPILGEIGIDLLGVRNPAVAFDPSWPRAEPVELTMPPTGRVVVEVERRGEGGGDPIEVALFAASEERPGIRWAGRAARQTAAVDASGRASFAYVPLRAKLIVHAWSEDAFEPWTATAPGPVRAGEEVVVRVRERPLAYVNAIATDATGVPLMWERLAIEM